MCCDYVEVKLVDCMAGSLRIEPPGRIANAVEARCGFFGVQKV